VIRLGNIWLSFEHCFSLFLLSLCLDLCAWWAEEITEIHSCGLNMWEGEKARKVDVSHVSQASATCTQVPEGKGCGEKVCVCERNTDNDRARFTGEHGR